MYLLKDITFELIPWSNEITGFTILIVAELFLGLLVDAIIIYALLKQRDIPIDSQFIISLTVADFLFSFFFTGMGMYGLRAGGFGIGQPGCLFSVIGVIYTLGMSILSITAMTIHRYLIVIHQFHMTQNHVYSILVTLWSGLAVIIGGFASSEYFLLNGVGLTSSLIYCFVAIASPEIMNKIAGLIIVFFIAVPMMFLAFAYFRIVGTYSALLAKKKGNESESSEKSPELYKNDRNENGANNGKPAQSRVKMLIENTSKLKKPASSLGGGHTKSNSDSSRFRGSRAMRPRLKSRTQQEIRLIKKAVAITGSFMICRFLVKRFTSYASLHS